MEAEEPKQDSGGGEHLACGERGRGVWEKEVQMMVQSPLRRMEGRMDCQERAKCQEKTGDLGVGGGEL